MNWSLKLRRYMVEWPWWPSGQCIPDDRQAAREMWRVLRPGGSLLLLDHARSHTRLGLMIQHALERNRQGEYYTRRPLDYLDAGGSNASPHESQSHLRQPASSRVASHLR
jgi:SAM-dependent methyltransferase